MNDSIKNAVRQHLEPLLISQQAHPVEPVIEVLWSEPHTMEVCTVRSGKLLAQMPPSKVAELVIERRKMIEKGGGISPQGDVIPGTDPVRHIYAPPEYRAIIMECVKKRPSSQGSSSFHPSHSVLVS